MTTVLVIGANRGIGLEFTMQYLARGDNVIGSICICVNHGTN